MSKQEGVYEQQKQVRKYQKINKEERRVVLELLIKDKLSLQEVSNLQKISTSPPNIYDILNIIQYRQQINQNQNTVQFAQFKKHTKKMVKKLKVQNILKISIVNPFTFQLSHPIVSSEVSQIYMDKQPTDEDQVMLAKEQHCLLQSQCQKLYLILTQQFQKAVENSNPLYKTTLQNLLQASQLVIRQLLEVKQQINVKQEHEPPSPNQTQYPFPIQHNLFQSQFGFVLPRINT
ncbi:unnamed protein product (macronuclear) [Paramecium tetraurelia]|uniref:Uncharacterized protein n=1 Tax=Paramecium tetraurelia TaxID=5888 RepID=A0CFP0_PARTE|nr:uncharacterized protein GSPATT00038047001 [Paramecium tetraurelia]CAK69607.1 unnamed protein product [Paramecium tetraurelia]|eukprot:XP_001437004.1 hypothetical protein (macronuclear) [Paramecium tetraurelia strain d4-2]